jgi:hypothetical protein
MMVLMVVLMVVMRWQSRQNRRQTPQRYFYVPDLAAPHLVSRYPFKGRKRMKIRATMAALALGVALSVSFAATPAFADNSQQSKMTTCNAQASGKKGDDRKAFMKDCLSSAPAAAAPMTQQQKMTACNKSATGKKGDDRKAFMKDCLSNKS